MSPHERFDPDGIQDACMPYAVAVDSPPIYAAARRQLASFKESVLLHADHPHERLFVAASDDANSDSGHAIFHMQRLPNGGGHA